MKKPNKFLTVWALVPLLCLTVSGCKKSEPEQETARPVYTMQVGGPAAGQTRSFSGVAKAEKEIAMSFRLGGQIIELNAIVGQKVSPNDVIARLDPKDAELQLSQSKAALANAQAKAQQAKADYERVRRLYESGSSSASELDAALAQFRSARANEDAMQKSLELNQQQLIYTTLASEVEGEIIEVPAEVYETVSAGQPIAKIVAGKQIKFEIGVPETLINYLKIGMSADLQFESFPGETFPARITELGRAPTQATTYPVTLVPVAREPRLRPGMVGEANFQFARSATSRTITLPVSVVAGEGAESYVWVVDPETSTVHKRPVQVGKLESSGVVIESGLSQGDVVVTRGVYQVEEGMKVKPIPDKKVSP